MRYLIELRTIAGREIKSETGYIVYENSLLACIHAMAPHWGKEFGKVVEVSPFDLGRSLYRGVSVSGKTIAVVRIVETPEPKVPTPTMKPWADETVQGPHDKKLVTGKPYRYHTERNGSRMKSSAFVVPKPGMPVTTWHPLPSEEKRFLPIMQQENGPWIYLYNPTKD